LAKSFRLHYEPRVESSSNREEFVCLFACLFSWRYSPLW